MLFKKSFNYYKKYFISIYPWKKISLLANIRSKYVIRRANIYFWRHETWLNFSFKSLSFSILLQIFFSREMHSIRTCKNVHLEKAVKFRLSGYYSFWNFSNSWRMENHLRRVSSSHFLESILIETSNVLFLNLLLCTLPFHNVMKFKGFKTYKKIYYLFPSLVINNRGEICFLRACLKAYIAWRPSYPMRSYIFLRYMFLKKS